MMSDYCRPGQKPELLCPAGSPEALDAAIAGGADAIYLGSAGFNARAGAKNFDGQSLADGIRRAHAYGVKIYLTLNTLVWDRELEDYLRTAETALSAGADALIVADAGGAALIRRYFPQAELHASTQMSGHTKAMGAELQKLGFSRMVVARETSYEDLKTICRESPIEVEMFIHGALCVCHSGQCLFSSVVGGRSGNRGECAQPCRLPYGKGKYPLSLKDLSLARHIPELLTLGVASLKIEGRMKSPAYVYGVTRIWRRLLDEGRSATEQEMRELSDLFSRGGFTDGYFTGAVGKGMLGIRSETDKEISRTAVNEFPGLTKRVPLDMRFLAHSGKPISLTVTAECGGSRKTVTAEGGIPQAAQAKATGKEDLLSKLTRLGGTPYEAREVQIETESELLIPFSEVNALRRRAVELLEDCPPQEHFFEGRIPDQDLHSLSGQFSRNATENPVRRIGIFTSPEQITEHAKKWFDRIYLSAECFSREDSSIPTECSGIVLPPVIFDSERAEVLGLLRRAAERNVKDALVGNLGHLSLVAEAGLNPVGDFRLNIANRASVATVSSLGISRMILSPELTLPRLRDLFRAEETLADEVAAIVYGRLPLMVVEKCVGKELGGCELCRRGELVLTDRIGAKFPVRRIFRHRNVIYNSVPTYMADRQAVLTKYGIRRGVYLFTTETPAEVDGVLRAYDRGLAPSCSVRRIGN